MSRAAPATIPTATGLVTSGHNAPPLAERLPLDYAELVTSTESLAARANALPKAIKTDADLGPVGNVVKDARALVKDIEGKRTAEKEPHLEAGRIVDGFFGTFKARLERIATDLNAKATAYNREKEAAERLRLQQEAKKRAEEAEALRLKEQQAAERNRQQTAVNHAARAEVREEQAHTLAQAATQTSAADLTRVRTESGVVATTATSWDFEIEDLDAIPLDRLRPYLGREVIEKAIRAYLRQAKQDAKLDGVRFFQAKSARFR